MSKRLTNFCFLNDSFRSGYAKKPIKGSEDSDDSLKPKNSSLGWRPGQVTSANKTQNTPTYDVTHREHQTQTEKLFFQSELEDLPNP